MSDRLKGSLLLVVGMLIVAGVSNGTLPILSFWLGLFLYPIGGYLLLKGNRQARVRLEKQIDRSLHPTIRSQSAMKFAELQSDEGGESEEAARQPAPRQTQTQPPALRHEAIELDQTALNEICFDEVELDQPELDLGMGSASEEDPGFKVSTDVSFPIEAQDRAKIAAELRKLVRLFEDGVLDEHEFDLAKTKLLC